MSHRFMQLLLALAVSCAQPGEAGEGEGEAGEGEGEGDVVCGFDVCADNEVCVGDVCRHRCDVDSGCFAGLVCCDGFCTPDDDEECLPCRLGTDDCAADQTCVTFRNADFDAGLGVCSPQVDDADAIADFGDCSQTQTTSRNVCRRGRECLGDMCTAFCRTQTDCADGELCTGFFTSPDLGRCMSLCDLDDDAACADNGSAVSCILFDASDCRSICVQPGTGVVGDPCRSTEFDCEPGTTCNFDASGGHCVATCDVTASTCDADSDCTRDASCTDHGRCVPR